MVFLPTYVDLHPDVRCARWATLRASRACVLKTQKLARSELEEKEPAVSYLNVVADRSGRFAAAVVLHGGNVGIVGWAGNAPICDTCVGGEHSQRRGCGHARAFAEHVTKEKGAIPSRNTLLFRGRRAEPTLMCAVCARSCELADALAEAGVLTDEADDNSDPPDVDSVGSVLGKPEHPRPLDIAGTETGLSVHARLRRNDKLPECPDTGAVLLSAAEYAEFPCTQWYVVSDPSVGECTACEGQYRSSGCPCVTLHVRRLTCRVRFHLCTHY